MVLFYQLVESITNDNLESQIKNIEEKLATHLKNDNISIRFSILESKYLFYYDTLNLPNFDRNPKCEIRVEISGYGPDERDYVQRAFGDFAFTLKSGQKHYPEFREAITP